MRTHAILQHNLKQLKQMRLLNGKQLNIVELLMPDELIYEDSADCPAATPIFILAN
jgi:agmatine deiminase